MTFGWINYFNSLVDWIELRNSVSHVHWLSSTIFFCSFVRLSPGAGGTPPASVTFPPLLQFYLFLPLLVHERTDKHTCEYRLYIIELEFWIRNFILKRAGLIVQLSFCHVYLESKKIHYKDWREEILTEIVEIWLAAKFEDIKRGKLLKLCVLL